MEPASSRPLAIAVPLASGTSREWDGHIECRVSQDDGTTWSEWFPLENAVITGRKFEWRLVGTIYDLLTTMRTVRAEVWIEVPLRSVQGSDVALDPVTGHLSVVYAVPFMATPTVQLTARQDIDPTTDIVITSSDRDHFEVQHREDDGTGSGTIVPVPGGSIDYFVQGFGGHS